MTQTEIAAAATGLAVGTVGQYVKALLKAFEVRSTLELVVNCYKRGVGTAEEGDLRATLVPQPVKRRRAKRPA